MINNEETNVSIGEVLENDGLIVIAGRPVCGKTYLAAAFAAYEADTLGNVAFFSLGLGPNDLSNGLVSALNNKDRTCRVSAFEKSIKQLSQGSIQVDDTHSMTAEEICSRARWQVRENGATLIVIDYLQLFSPSCSCADIDLETSHAVRSLKQLSRDLDVPVIVLSQLCRGVDERSSPRPFLTDLPSRSIESGADAVIFSYRENVRGRTVFRSIVAKNRAGEEGNLTTKYSVLSGAERVAERLVERVTA